MASLVGKKRSFPPLSSCTSRNTDLELDKYRICLSAINCSSKGKESETQWYVFNIGTSGEDCLSLEIQRLNKLLKTAHRCQKLDVQRVVEKAEEEEEFEGEDKEQHPVPSSRLFPPPEISPPIATHNSPSRFVGGGAEVRYITVSLASEPLTMRTQKEFGY